jgi:hypothetical protein
MAGYNLLCISSYHMARFYGKTYHKYIIIDSKRLMGKRDNEITGAVDGG